MTQAPIAANDQPGVMLLPSEAPSQTVALIGIDYDEFKPETYRGCFVIVSERGREVGRRTFDWWDQAEAYALSLGHPVGYLASVDDFGMDSRKA